MEDPGHVPGSPAMGHVTADEDARLQGRSHQELASLLAGANPQALIQRGEALESAAESVAELNSRIWSAARDLEWEGQAAEGFRDWIRRFFLESDNLKSYASLVGAAMSNAGVALRQAQSEMPPAPQIFEGTGPDPGFQTLLPSVAAGPQETSRQEAIAAITRLGSVYKASAWTIANTTEPEFPQVPEGGVFGDSASSPPGYGNRPLTPVASPNSPPAAPSYPTGVVPGVGVVPDDSVRPTSQAPGMTSRPGSGLDDADVGTSFDSVGVVPNGSAPPAPPVSPPPAVPDRPVMGGGPVQQPVVGPLPGWPGQSGPGRGGGGSVPPVRGPVPRSGEVPGTRGPSGPPAGPGSQPPPVGRPASPGMPGGQQPPVGRPPTTGTGPGAGNPWGRANNYGLLGGKPVSNAKPTVASRIPPGGVIQPGMNPSNSRLVPTRNDQPAAPRGTFGKAVGDGRNEKGGARKRALPKPTGVIGLPGPSKKSGKKKNKKNESKDDRQP